MSFTRIVRVHLADPAPLLRELELTEDVVHLPASRRRTRPEALLTSADRRSYSVERPMRRATLRGVPAKQVDVLVPPHMADTTWVANTVYAPPSLALDVGEKEGKYDGAVRRRYTLLALPEHQLRTLPTAYVRVVREGAEEDGGIPVSEHTVRVLPHEEVGGWSGDAFRGLRHSLEEYSLPRIWMWHLRRYYLHLVGSMPEDELRQAADSWAAVAEAEGALARWTLAEANRSASRDLYRVSRESGWRKLTLREREAWGIDGGCWHRDEAVLRARETREGTPSGCGEATLRAARGGEMGGGPDAP
jgi:hypothetical protein